MAVIKNILSGFTRAVQGATIAGLVSFTLKKGGRSLGQAISTTQAIKRGFRPAANEKEVSVAPRNMEYAGYTKEYWDKMGFEN